MTTHKDIQESGLLTAIAECFGDSVAAGTLLSKANISKIDFPPFGQPSILEWWNQTVQQIEVKYGKRILLQLLQEAADCFPGDKRFTPYLQEKAKIKNRKNKGGNINIKFPESYGVNDVIRILQIATETAIATGADVNLNIGQIGSSNFSISVTGEHTDEEIETIKNAIAQNLTQSNYPAEVTVDPYHFRDYFTDPIELEGPDGQRFAADQIRASTTVGDIARGLVNQYADSGTWPNRQGQRTHAVVDRVLPDGSHQRLDPRETLHDAGVRPNDVLIISPERTAGNIHPMLREAALARVRNEVLAYAQAHQGFEVQANSLVAPTEYLFRFSAWGFAPPKVEGGAPFPISTHAVLIWLSPNFPVHAPEAWWQTDIFHPNIEPKSGAVCLGALKDHYRPAMDFGELCQMLIDLASYRNYATAEGYNAQAQQWASSLDGQITIEAIGGISNIGKMMLDQAAKRPLKIRRLQP